MPALVAVLLVAVLLLGLLWSFQRRLVYFPGPALRASAGELLPGARNVTLRTADGLELGAWLMPAGAAGRGVTVLVANGNAGDRSMRAPLAAALAREGLSVLLFDYRGFGGNPGTPTEEGLQRDIRAAQRFLMDEVGVPSNRLLYYGESLGAAVVTRLAAEQPPAGLALRSPFVDLASVGRAHYPFLPVHPLLLKDRFPVARLLARLSVPTVVVYGTADSVVPPDQSRAVAAAAAGPASLVAVAGADHNDRVLLDGSQLIDAVVALAEQSTGRVQL